MVFVSLAVPTIIAKNIVFIVRIVSVGSLEVGALVSNVYARLQRKVGPAIEAAGVVTLPQPSTPLVAAGADRIDGHICRKTK